MGSDGVGLDLTLSRRMGLDEMENKKGLSSSPPASTLESPQEREETHNWKDPAET